MRARWWRDPGLGAAEVQLPGHRPAGLGHGQLRYRGPKIDRAGLLRYLVSYREHAEFHEQCVERIFSEVSARCRPHWLEVEARYTRRGGLDINPWRASPGIAAPAATYRELRQ